MQSQQVHKNSVQLYGHAAGEGSGKLRDESGKLERLYIIFLIWNKMAN